jgi:hypothetical protein
VDLFASLSPVFLAFANRIGLLPFQGISRLHQRINVSGFGLAFFGLTFQRIEHVARHEPVPDLTAGSGLIEEVYGDDLLATSRFPMQITHQRRECPASRHSRRLTKSCSLS